MILVHRVDIIDVWGPWEFDIFRLNPGYWIVTADIWARTPDKPDARAWFMVECSLYHRRSTNVNDYSLDLAPARYIVDDDGFRGYVSNPAVENEEKMREIVCGVIGSWGR